MLNKCTRSRQSMRNWAVVVSNAKSLRFHAVIFQMNSNNNNKTGARFCPPLLLLSYVASRNNRKISLRHIRNGPKSFYSHIHCLSNEQARHGNSFNNSSVHSSTCGWFTWENHIVSHSFIFFFVKKKWAPCFLICLFCFFFSFVNCKKKKLISKPLSQCRLNKMCDNLGKHTHGSAHMRCSVCTFFSFHKNQEKKKLMWWRTMQMKKKTTTTKNSTNYATTEIRFTDNTYNWLKLCQDTSLIAVSIYSAVAAYFGVNKVESKDLHFKRMQSNAPLQMHLLEYRRSRKHVCVGREL